MAHTDIRLCKSCERQLPGAAPSNQKYCSSTCRERIKKRRKRLKAESENLSEVQRLHSIEQQYDKLQAEHRKLRQRLRDRDLTIRRLKYGLRGTELQVEVVAEEQAERTRTALEQLAMAKSEVATLRRRWSQKVASDTSSREVTELRDRLAAVTGRYNDLVAKYRELSEAAQYAATERKYLQGIVRQWDSMCKRLHTATKGQPRREADQKILATWQKFRQAVR